VRLLSIYEAQKSRWQPWTRYWTEWTSNSDEDAVKYLPYEGYLRRTDAAIRALSGHRRLLTLDSVEAAPCVVLLGDAGAGKSATLVTHAYHLSKTITNTDDCLIAFEGRDLKSLRDVAELLDSDATLARWLHGAGVLHLLIDGLDEAPLGAENVADALAQRLEHWPVNRLRLRMTVQSTVYKMIIKTVLQSALRKSAERKAEVENNAESTPAASKAHHVEVLYLQGLQRTDASSLALKVLKSQTSVDAFLGAISRADAEPFASLPLTLLALLEQYRTTGTLRVRVPELFESLCASLCRPRRLDDALGARTAGRMNDGDWMDVAAGICAALVFSQSDGLWLASTPAPDSYLRLDAFLGVDVHPFGAVGATRQQMLDAASSALFTADPESHGSAVVATKRPYAEFLTALWMWRANLSAEQALQLLGSGDPRALPVLPHLRNVATWLASISEDYARAIIAVDPEATIWHERADLPTSARPVVVDALLRRADDNTLREPMYGLWRSFKRLRHAGLGTQLIAAVVDRSRQVESRKLALKIGQASDVSELDHVSTKIALDATEQRSLRVEAARTVAFIGTAKSRPKLQTLACDDDSSDDEQLRGAALSAAWETLDPKQLFVALRPRRRENFYGSYAAAMDEIADGLQERYAPFALDWLHAVPNDLSFASRRINDAAVSLVLRSAAHSVSMRKGFAKLVVARAAKYQSLWSRSSALDTPEGIELLSADDSHRQRILSSLIDALAVSQTKPTGPSKLAWPEAHAAFDTVGVKWTRADLEFVVRNISQNPINAVKSHAALSFVRSFVSWPDIDHVTVLWPHRADPKFLDLFDNFPADQVSPAAAILESERRRAEHERTYERERRDRARARAHRDAAEHEANQARAPHTSTESPRRDSSRGTTGTRPSTQTWEQISDGLHGGAEIGESRLRVALVQSDDMSTYMRRRIVDAAIEFLESRPSLSFTGHRNGSLPKDGHLGCHALLTVAHLNRKRLRDLSDRTVDVWIPTWLRFWSHDESLCGVFDLALQDVVRNRHTKTASAIAHAVIAGSGDIEAPDAPMGPTFKHKNAVQSILDLNIRGELSVIGDRLCAIVQGNKSLHIPLTNALRRFELGPVVADLVLDTLIRSGQTRAVTRILYAVAKRADESPQTRCLAALTAACGLRSSDMGLRSKALAALWASPLIARDAFWWLANGTYRARGIALQAWSAVELERLLRLHMMALPPEAGEDDSRSRSDEFRAAVYKVLSEHGSVEALQVWDRIVQDMPERRWLARYRFDAHVAFSRTTAKPVSPQTLWQVRRSRDQRLVRTNAELLYLIGDALDLLQNKLHGELPMIESLWDEQRSAGDSSTSKWKPKREAALSDIIARELRTVLAQLAPSIAREGVLKVERRRAAKGQRTDLDISVSMKGSEPSLLRVIVEVKGSWHNDVGTAMEVQLVREYLKQNHLDTGLYVVGYFTSPCWRDPDAARSRRLGTLEDLRTRLRSQAAALSGDGIAVEARVLDCRIENPKALQT
jgi:hypothetical protein